MPQIQHEGYSKSTESVWDEEHSLQTGLWTGAGEHGEKERLFKWLLLLDNSNLREVHYRGQFVSHHSQFIIQDLQNSPVALCCPRKPNSGDFMCVCSLGVPPSGSKSDGLFLKITSPKPHCYRHVLAFNKSHVCHVVPSVTSLMMMELFKARAIKQNEMALLKKSYL